MKKIVFISVIFASTFISVIGRINEPTRVTSRRLVKNVDTKTYLKESLEMVAPRRPFWKNVIELFTRASNLRSFQDGDLNW
jgi:hypothetical protein